MTKLKCSCGVEYLGLDLTADGVDNLCVDCDAKSFDDREIDLENLPQAFIDEFANPRGKEDGDGGVKL